MKMKEIDRSSHIVGTLENRLQLLINSRAISIPLIKDAIDLEIMNYKNILMS